MRSGPLCRLAGSAGWGLHLLERAVQSASHLDQGRTAAPDDLGIQQAEGGAQSEGQARDERDRGQTTVGHQLPLAGRGNLLGPLLTGMQESVLEGPVLAEIVQPLFSFCRRRCPSCYGSWAGKLPCSKVVT